MMQLVPTRNDLIRLIQPGWIGAEIGVRRGEFSLEFLKLPIKKIFLVDAWTCPPSDSKQAEQDLITCRHNLRGHAPGGRFEIIRGISADVARKWTGPKLDFLYIDACHDYEAVKEDLALWSAHLQPHGLLMGHDYTDSAVARTLGFGVVRAVREFCESGEWEMTHLTNEDFSSFCLIRGAWLGAEA